MAESGKRRWWSFSPAGFGAFVGLNAFLWTMIIPVLYVTPYASERSSNRRAALTPEQVRFLEYVEREWTEEAVVPKAFRIGLASGIVAATTGVMTRSLKRRRAGYPG